MPSPAAAQEFGAPIGALIRQQASNAQLPVLLAVQQAISALPPQAGQSFLWEYDPMVGAFQRSSRLGPISFRTPDLVGEGAIAARLAGSYFELSESFGPVTYVGTLRGSADEVAYGATRLGLGLKEKVGIISMSGAYGVTDWLDLLLNVPITVIDSQGTSYYTSPASGELAGLPVAAIDFESAEQAVNRLDGLVSNGTLVTRSASVNQFGSFPEGSNVGLGRILVAGKARLLSLDWLNVALSQEFSLPSPSSDELAGTDSLGVLPRLIVSASFWSNARLHFDAGYEFDTEFKELWRATWNAGTSLLFPWATVDLGFGGSKYLQEVYWSPQQFDTGSGTLRVAWDAQAATDLGGTSFVDFLFGAKVKITDDAVIGGSVAVPVTDDGLRPAAAGTLAFEYLF